MTQENRPKNIAVLGSTGSIGQNSLDVIRQHPGEFKALYLTANTSLDKLAEQARQFRPKAVVIGEPQFLSPAREKLQGICPVLGGMEGILEVVQDPEVDLVLNSLVGGVGVRPTYHAIRAGKNIALANKETLVMAGGLVTAAARENGVRIFPIDSEHSAIWQCLRGEEGNPLRRILLTGSGGPFRTWPADRLNSVTVEQALQHPNWNMGAKITIDSATMMNKGLEVIEAFWLYDTGIDQLEVVIHPQSVIHSMVEFQDGSVKAQLGLPDMRIPIQYALSYPRRLPLKIEHLDFRQLKSLTFQEPDFEKFPCLQMAFAALKQGGTAPAAMNSANEVAVESFLRGKINFTAIPEIIQKTVENHPFQSEYTLSEILDQESRARKYAGELIKKYSL